MDAEDTICAIATPPGYSAIGIVRVSGSRAFPVVQSIWKGATPLSDFASHTVHHGTLHHPHTQKIIDHPLLLIMKRPRSYTGEDMVEIQSHGNPYLLQQILSLLIEQGARLATPGEFTRRAFMSGRIDLSQAEAVMELIDAQSTSSQAVALEQLHGTLSKRIFSLRDRILNLLAHIEASIDFSEEGIVLMRPDEMHKRLTAILSDIQALLQNYRFGKKIREGMAAVIVGRPNVGKSSLMNALLQEDRAIVTPHPGTTRDALQEWISCGGMMLKLVDTAGMRETEDPMEREGIRRGEAALVDADMVLWVLDASEPLQPEDRSLARRLQDCRKIILLNKSDLPPHAEPVAFAKTWAQTLLFISATTGTGREALLKELERLLVVPVEKERPMVTLVRHYHALKRAEQAVARAIPLCFSLSWEWVASDLKDAADAVGEVVGVITTDAVLDEIFNSFCIGK